MAKTTGRGIPERLSEKREEIRRLIRKRVLAEAVATR